MKKYHQLEIHILYTLILLTSILVLPILIINFTKNTPSIRIIIEISSTTLLILLFITMYFAKSLTSYIYVHQMGAIKLNNKLSLSFFIVFFYVLWLVTLFYEANINNALVFLPIISSISWINPHILLFDDTIIMNPVPFETHQLLYYKKNISQKKGTLCFVLTDKREFKLTLKNSDLPIIINFLEDHNIPCSFESTK